MNNKPSHKISNTLDIVFLGLACFSQTGGIEKVNKAWLKALQNISLSLNIKFKSCFLLDDKAEIQYIHSNNFKGFKKQKINYALQSIYYALKADIVIVSHIHISPIIFLVKKIKPKLKVYIHAHGIEVWEKLSKLQIHVLKKADAILAVSQFTKSKLIQNYQIPENKIQVWPNPLDPFFDIPNDFKPSAFLKKRYAVDEETKVMFTLARLSSTEQYKGYDDVIASLPLLLLKYPKIVYLIGGKYDAVEFSRLNQLISHLGLAKQVKLLGYIPDEELTLHYVLADVYVMPSKGEGFGISFIEASACGTPVLASDADGSRQAIIPNKTGLTCPYGNINAIEAGISMLLNFTCTASQIQQITLENYSFEAYQEKIKQLLLNESKNTII